MSLLAAQNWFSYQRKGAHDEHLRKLTKNVSNAPVQVRAFLAQTGIRLDDLMGLQVGDFITTDKAREKEILIQVEGKNKFLGHVGQFRGSRAVQITRLIQQTADLPKEKTTGRVGEQK
jgi:flagellar motor switch protein FliM